LVSEIEDSYLTPLIPFDKFVYNAEPAIQIAAKESKEVEITTRAASEWRNQRVSFTY
jgi:hypothetical protein